MGHGCVSILQGSREDTILHTHSHLPYLSAIWVYSQLTAPTVLHIQPFCSLVSFHSSLTLSAARFHPPFFAFNIHLGVRNNLPTCRCMLSIPSQSLWVKNAGSQNVWMIYNQTSASLSYNSHTLTQIRQIDFLFQCQKKLTNTEHLHQLINNREPRLKIPKGRCAATVISTDGIANQKGVVATISFI